MKTLMKLVSLALLISTVSGCAYWWRSYCTEVLDKETVEIHGNIYDSNYKRIGTIDSH